MARNRVQTFMEINLSVPVLRPVMGLKRNNVFNYGVLFGSVEAVKVEI